MQDINSIDNIKEQLIEDFSFFEDWADKYKYLISFGNDMPEFPQDKMIEENFVRGCQSQVWFYYELIDNNKLKIYGTSDAAIVKGLIGLLIKVFNLQKPEDILRSDLSFIRKIGFDQHLSATRSNGLAHMIKSLKKAASDALLVDNN